MDSLKGKTFVIIGATGRQGSAVVRHLLKEGACVKVLTRDPNSKKAKQLTALRAELVTGDMADRDALTTLFQGAAGIYSVQNPYTSSIAAEIQQGKMWPMLLKQRALPISFKARRVLARKPGFPPGIQSWKFKNT